MWHHLTGVWTPQTQPAERDGQLWGNRYRDTPCRALAPRQTHSSGEQPATTAKSKRVPLKARRDLNVWC